MQVYVVLIEDESAPAYINVFAAKQIAVKYAKAYVEKHAYQKKDIEVNKLLSSGQVWQARYCPEGSTITVFEQKVIEAVK